jgi:hypothetical protein
LTPAIWKKAEQARRAPRRARRWSTQPLVLTLLVTTWCCGDSQAEHFETAKGFVAICLTKRRRPGKTVKGFQKALAKLPVPVLRALAAGVRRRLLTLLDLSSDGFVLLGCDGSELECPRVEELEQRLDPPRKNQEAPRIWVTALVHLRTGLLWAWHLGKGFNRERSHLQALLRTLPETALIVADAGYNGYEMAQAILAVGASFLIRASAKDTLYTDRPLFLSEFNDSAIWCWPLTARQAHLPPLRVRLIRIRGKTERHDVWLLTNVFDPQRLSVNQASQYYRWRWENEGLFRTYKRTLAKVKLLSRSIRLIHREAEGALLATQLLLAQGVRAMPQRQAQKTPLRCSPRQVLLTIRDVIGGRIGIDQRRKFRCRMNQARRERRWRLSAKAKRIWPQRVNRKLSKPPKILMLADDQKIIAHKLLRMIA